MKRKIGFGNLQVGRSSNEHRRLSFGKPGAGTNQRQMKADGAKQ